MWCQSDWNCYTFARIYSDKLTYVYPAPISKEITKKFCRLALATYRAVDCLDFGRVDIRTDFEHNPYVLEINPLPCLSGQDVFMTISEHHNIPFPQMIGKIIDAALKRYGIK